MSGTRGTVVIAMTCAAAVIAQVVGGKAVRDALFLTSLDVTALPAMLIATAGCSMLLVALQGRIVRTVAPRRLVPVSFALSAALFLVEWLARAAAPAPTAVVLYLHVSAVGPLLTSGFWLITSESFNPRTARRGVGRIAGAGTLGGLAGAAVAERVAAVSGAPAMLLVLAIVQIVTAVLVRALASAPATPVRREAARVDTSPYRPAARVIADAPHLRVLVALLLLGTTSAALLDYVFKARAVEAFGPGDQLLRFFATYYSVTSFLAFLLQMLASRAVLERFGLGLTTGAPSIALLAGGVGGLIAPGFGSVVVARAGESIFRGSWFRAGYELFYAPIPTDEKRTAKPLIDVGVERFGDALGGVVVAVVTRVGGSMPVSMILWSAMGISVGAIVAASRLNGWYIRTLERSLVRQGAGMAPRPTEDATGRVVRRMREEQVVIVDRAAVATTFAAGWTALPRNPALLDIRALHSSNPDRIKRVLLADEGLKPDVVSHVIPLLASDALADYALFALRKVAEERAGELTDALLDANQDARVRRRLAQVFSVCVSQRAADCLLLALDDGQFEVRAQAARSLAAMAETNPRLRFDRDRIFELVCREDLGDPAVLSGPGARGREALTHVFALLSLVLPREPLQIAFRGLFDADRHLRGTALEYLDSMFPPAVRSHLAPYLAGETSGGGRDRHAPTAGMSAAASPDSRPGPGAGWDQRAVAGFGAV
jgi:hypothetical protein